MTSRREFVKRAVAASVLPGFASGCNAFFDTAKDEYAVAILGDTHFDAEPESVYHSHYDESNRWAKIQHEEFRRNGEMWRKRCRDLLAASAALAAHKRTDLILQLGDIIQGDCDDVETHKRMLDDCIRMLRSPYPKGLPFLTVVGNHDFRGKGAWDAYFEFAEPFLSKELGQDVRYPAFSFRKGPDQWIFCNFEDKNLDRISDLIERERDVRHTFLVTHGPFTTPDGGSVRWRLGGRKECEKARPRLYELLSRRHAVVLSGHTHTVAWYRHENAFGGFSEFTANSVWKGDDLATAEPVCDSPADYGTVATKTTDRKKLADVKAELDFFRPGLKGYFMNRGAGHFRLNVSAKGVTMDFYPGAADHPARTFVLR